ncbi:MAG TPA: hypothetical protein VGX25_06025 [Actinophytocola sp.]|uniref:hypothetical protein n=1 Tax=Actinophytocola sp. TaxID=1872138 RepID=UPI002DDCF925|nr:hypothetical protein [Actinophytocola sp.]HEV2778943.1 hypothetical protein [Actinophytocola sp.]
MATSTVSADLAAQHGLPGLLGINRHHSEIFVELDLPQHADRIDEKFVPGVEALVIGFLKRLVARSKSAQREGRTAGVFDDYVAAWVHADDLDHFLISLAALWDGAATDQSHE